MGHRLTAEMGGRLYAKAAWAFDADRRTSEARPAGKLLQVTVAQPPTLPEPLAARLVYVTTRLAVLRYVLGRRRRMAARH